MADKLTQQLTDALARAAADSGGQLLFATKTDPGLFPATAKAAAQKCVADGLIYPSATDNKGRSPRELFALTEKGWEYLLAQVNPKQVLEDFVRVLEARQGEVGELLGTARRMADSLQGLKDAVSRVLPKVSSGKIQQPNPPTPFPEREGGADLLPSPRRGGAGGGVSLSEAILARLADWSGNAGEDCPLPDLFRALSALDSPPTIGAFHDALRELQAAGSVALHSWTGPLYALPEPAYALLVGHGIAYYASARNPVARGQRTEVREQPALAGSGSC
ncbi:MAG TPA: hypothetical protein VMZ71_10565 [Gemmataceae bacterium]|nr:hypothetical protein [Gemmataceae bacterium]